MNAPTIIIRHAHVAYKGHILFDNLDLTLPANQCTCLLGPSGVGKSSLLRLIAHLVTDNTSAHADISCDNGIPVTQQLSYMAQTDLLMPWLSALDNALLSARLQNILSPTILAQANTLFAQVGLENARHKYPYELSGGMRQRVALVRTLLQNKPIILMDEPFSALDAITRFQLQTMTTQLFKNRTVLLITHDPLEALRVADVIYILSGQPALLSAPMRLTTPTPRDPADSEFIAHQAELFHALIQAKEISV